MMSRPPFLGHPGETVQSTPLSGAARATHRRIIRLLKRMIGENAGSPLDPAFARRYYELLALIGTYQQEVLACEHRTPSCGKGCSACCLHWVEDVNSFEAVLIADYIRRRLPHRAAAIVARCRDDMAAMEALDEQVHETMRRSTDERATAGAQFDHVDLLLAGFHRLRRPCPLLDSDGTCMVYALRPITCRIYVSFSPPALCDPDHADDHDIPTVMLDIEESASTLIDRLHARYDRFDNDTSLRSLLAVILKDIAD